MVSDTIFWEAVRGCPGWLFLRWQSPLYCAKIPYMASNMTQIQERIYTIRERRVMLDSDLAELYEVEVKQLNQAVKRNIKRFPVSSTEWATANEGSPLVDFMFRLTKDEFTEVVTNCDHLQNLKYRPSMPYAFTEQGVAMLATVLNSQKRQKIGFRPD